MISGLEKYNSGSIAAHFEKDPTKANDQEDKCTISNGRQRNSENDDNLASNQNFSEDMAVRMKGNSSPISGESPA